MSKSLNSILIVFDAAGYSPVSIQTVIELAERLKAQIQAIYIEDSNLLSAVELPFIREISLHNAEIRSIDTAQVMQRLRADAESIKKQIEEIALAQRVVLNFSSMRGRKIQVVRNRSGDVAMVLIPAAYSSASRKAQHHLKHVVALIYDDTSATYGTALNIAISMAHKNAAQLFVVADSMKSKQAAQKIVELHPVSASYQLVNFGRPTDVIQALKNHSPGLLVLSDDSVMIKNEQVLSRMIDSMESDILLVC